MYVNAKMITAETVPGIGRGDGGERWRGEFKYDIFDTFVNATVYPHPAQQLKNKKRERDICLF
jgi:hypothetical protein